MESISNLRVFMYTFVYVYVYPYMESSCRGHVRGDETFSRRSSELSGADVYIQLTLIGTTCALALQETKT